MKIWVWPQQFVSINFNAGEEMEGDSLGLLDQQVWKEGLAQVQEETLSQKYDRKWLKKIPMPSSGFLVRMMHT